MTQLHFDLNGTTHYLSSPWSFGVNVSRASLLLNKNIQRHLLMGRDELGFRHVRFHGIFDPSMSVLHPDGSYDFSSIERVLDWLMEQGFSPFIALDGVPTPLAREGSPRPADEAKWVDLVRALASFVDGRYGCDAQEWHFEVWPGADQASRWDAHRDAYFRFYDLAARAVKSVNTQLKVGGASAADPEWSAAFIEHVARPSEDFSGTAVPATAAVPDPQVAYAGNLSPVEDSATDATGANSAVATAAPPADTPSADVPSTQLDVQRCDFVTVSGLTEGLSQAPLIVDRLSPVRVKLTEALGETTPVILSAWNRGGTNLSPENDRCGAGSFVADVAASTAELVGGILYDCMSDIDQPGVGTDEPIRYEPFHGGRGLVTVNDVRKASFNAFRLLNEHVGYKLEWRWHEPTPGLTALVTKDYHNVIRILASYDKVAGTAGPSRSATPAKFTLEGLPESVKYGQVQVLRPAAGSAVEAWTESGKPMFINRHLLDDLEAGAHPAIAEVKVQDFPPRLESGMTLQLTIPLPDDLMTMD